jgi:hypothetical protein
MKYDIIGDIHGHADELTLLLGKLDYKQNANGVFEHASRTAIFVGDLIDRGPKIRETLQIVKSMVDAGKALCTRGNHEDNAINFWKKNEKGDYDRKHSIKNIVQHFATIKAFQNREDEWLIYLKWFETLPYYIEIPGVLRVAHACWPSELTKLIKSSPVESVPYLNLDLKNQVIRGEEMPMPDGINYADKDGNIRTASRTQWWLNPRGLTYRQYFEAYVHALPACELQTGNLFLSPKSNQISLAAPGCDKNTGLDAEIPESVLANIGTGYPEHEVPIFFGHYWLRGEPKAQTSNVCCLDYSVAKGGSLIAYRFDGEKLLDNSKFVTVDGLSKDYKDQKH